jgi:hypothetical protein
MNRVGRRTIFALLLIDTATRIWGRSATLYFLGTNTDEVFATTKLRTSAVTLGLAYKFRGPVVANY